MRNLITGQTTELKRTSSEILQLEQQCYKLDSSFPCNLQQELNEDVLHLQSTLQEFFLLLSSEKKYFTQLLQFLRLDAAQQYSIMAAFSSSQLLDGSKRTGLPWNQHKRSMSSSDSLRRLGMQAQELKIPLTQEDVHQDELEQH